ncbi:glycosyltransferase [Ferruginibacter sp. SUN002]|uniref:glycosyltransferase n=1 Tax=Ferruginibacter sp. SUN002 TaxID=2937789 RepID=UPI003D36DD40
MIATDFNKTYKQPVILVAPLSWGLGHATRCIPIINELLAEGCKVIIAGEGPVEILLKREFPKLDFLHLDGYDITYSRYKLLLPLKMIVQMPKVLAAIRKENKWLREAVKAYKIDAVISDNRYGLYHTEIPSVFITHQLLIKTGNLFTEKIVQKINYSFIKKYTECWVPDFGRPNKIAGDLSHPAVVPENEKYIGCLSRFKKFDNVKKKYDLLVLISGPEPQRTIFEELLLLQLKDYHGYVLFVRGLPDVNDEKKATNTAITIINHLASNELNEAIQQSAMVISRSGYTTIMDLIKLQQKAILIPTPGQTEQEYLAKNLTEQKIFYCVAQDKFILKEAIEAANNFSPMLIHADMEQYKKRIEVFVKSLR